jgi:hypothetical protein
MTTTTLLNVVCPQEYLPGSRMFVFSSLTLIRARRNYSSEMHFDPMDSEQKLTDFEIRLICLQIHQLRN